MAWKFTEDGNIEDGDGNSVKFGELVKLDPDDKKVKNVEGDEVELFVADRCNVRVNYISDDTDISSDINGGVYGVITKDKSINVTLPDDPDDEFIVFFTDVNNNAQNNTVSIKGNGKNINDSEDDLNCDVNGFLIGLSYDDEAGSWYIINKN